MFYLLGLSGRPSVFCATRFFFFQRHMNNLGLHIFQIVARYLELCCNWLQWYSRGLVSSSRIDFQVIN